MTTPNEITISDVVAEWKADAIIDEATLNREICKTPNLHSKYLGFYVHFKKELATFESRLYRLGNIKRKYYRGECTAEDLKKYGWEQFQGLKPSMTELNSHLEYDVDMIKAREKVAELKTAVASIEYILKSIAGRDYSIKSLVEYNRYINGG